LLLKALCFAPGISGFFWEALWGAMPLYHIDDAEEFAVRADRGRKLDKLAMLVHNSVKARYIPEFSKPRRVRTLKPGSPPIPPFHGAPPDVERFILASQICS
jgi:hypothetical protein